MIKINGIPCLTAVLEKPLLRAWWADLDVDIATTVASTATLTAGTTTLRGTVAASEEFGTRKNLTVVGGSGKLGTEIPARHYGPTTRLAVGTDILRDAGETPAQSSWERVTGAWSRRSDRAAACLDALGEWRVQDDGSVLLGPPSWAIRPALTVLDYDRDLRVIRFLADDISVEPGYIYGDKRVTRVRYIAHRDSFQGFAWI